MSGCLWYYLRPMLTANGVTIQFGQRVLFDNVNLAFTPGNCYGIIGANGSGKSTFMKVLAGDIEPTAGSVALGPNERLSMLRQDQFAFDEFTPVNTVIMGHKKLYQVIQEKDAIYAKPDFGDADGARAAELESLFAEMDGWNAEAEAEKLLSELGIPEKFHRDQMKNLKSDHKVRVLLAQALFGNPDVLLLDEPTNHLDVETAMWLENFLAEFKNTAIVVSHDRHFLDQVCTHTCDIDFGKITFFSGNYSFWKESSELALRQKTDKNKKMEDKRAELQSFIARFSANASKARQATSRKKMLEKLTLEDIKPSSRKYPFIGFNVEREAGNDLLSVNKLSKSIDGKVMFKNLNFEIHKGDKVAFFGRNDLSRTTFFQVLTEELSADEGTFKWGASTTRSYFPKENKKYFDVDLSLIDWLRQFSKETHEQFIRGFLGRMLFTGEESLKKVNVLSGGERVRMMLSKMMLVNANVLIMDEPTNHLDLESISALNDGLQKFKGTLLFSTQDHQFIQTVANRIIEISPLGYIDKSGVTLDDYLADPDIQQKRALLYADTAQTAS